MKGFYKEIELSCCMEIKLHHISVSSSIFVKNKQSKATNLAFRLILADRMGYIKAQFEVGRRSYGQSTTNSRFFSCLGQNNFTGCHSFFRCALEKMFKINSVVALH